MGRWARETVIAYHFYLFGLVYWSTVYFAETLDEKGFRTNVYYTPDRAKAKRFDNPYYGGCAAHTNGLPSCSNWTTVVESVESTHPPV